MRQAALILAAAIALVSSVHAGTVVNLPKIGSATGLRNYGGTATSVNVDGHTNPNDGGGGQFLQVGNKDDLSCAPGVTDDDGVVIVESTVPPHKCWFRQFSGPVHLPWYGVADASTSGCYGTAFSGCNATSALNAAFAAAAQSAGLGGDGGVTTDGRSIAILGDVTIPENQYLTCSGTPGGSRDQTSDHPYWVLPNSIVLDPAHTLVRSKQSRLSDCIIRPTWYVPQTSPFNIPASNASDLVQLVRQFKGTATSCDGKNCPMEDMFIIGFDTCEDNNQSLKSVLSDLQEECLVDEWIHNNGGGMKL
jgi:hypothetical protein